MSDRKIDGVVIRPLETHKDSRGSFTEVYQRERDAGINAVQWSVVRSEAGTLRGMHLHLRHDEYFLTLEGRAYVGLYDLRPGSPSFRSSMLIELPAEPMVSVCFPIGLLHGWYFPERSTHLQAVSESYGSYADDDNWGCRWDDPGLNLDWPDTPPLVSERSRAFPSLPDIEKHLMEAGLWSKIGVASS
jgi:dTDP-4-dehydrorhamnose 3,5-epimerase